jgi:hypothetical protein
MNYDVPHTVILVYHPRVRLDFLRPARILGPGVFHFEGDLRYRLRTMTQRKIFDRGAAEAIYATGDTMKVLGALVQEALKLNKGPFRENRIVVLTRLLEIAEKQAAAGARVGDFSAPVDNALLVAFQAEEAARKAKEDLEAQAARFHAAPQGIPREGQRVVAAQEPEEDGAPVDQAVRAKDDAYARAARTATAHQDQAIRHARALQAGLPRQGDNEMEPVGATPEALNRGPQEVEPVTDPVPAPATVPVDDTAALLAAADAVIAAATPVPAPAPEPEQEPEAPVAVVDQVKADLAAIEVIYAAKEAAVAAEAAAAVAPSPAGEEVPVAPVQAPLAPVPGVDGPDDTGVGEAKGDAGPLGPPVPPEPVATPNPGVRSGKKKNRY